MADFVLSLVLFIAGAGWAFVCILAGASHPTGAMPIRGFVIGIALAICGAAYFAFTLFNALS